LFFKNVVCPADGAGRGVGNFTVTSFEKKLDQVIFFIYDHPMFLTAGIKQDNKP